MGAESTGGHWTADLRPELTFECPAEVPAGFFHSATHIGSSPRVVMQASHRTWDLNTDWLLNWLLRRADPNGTPFTGLRRLLPGQCIGADRSGALVRRETFGPGVWSSPHLAGGAAVGAFSSAIRNALQRIVADAQRVTSELSGGLDSTYMVGCLAKSGVAVDAFTWTPHAQAQIPQGRSDDFHFADLLRRQYSGAVTLTPIRSTSTALVLARQLTREALWPSFGPTSQPWVYAVRQRAAANGAAFVLSGVHGNASFSWDHRRPRLRSRLPRRAAPQRFFTEPVALRRPSRRRWLTWLAGQDDVFAAINTPGVYPVPRRDPYRDREVLEVAAQITPATWRASGRPREFARLVGDGVVPDAIRLNTRRFAQSSDAWFVMRNERPLYDQYAEILQETPELHAVVDVDEVICTVRSWPWGEATPAPPLPEIATITRILAMAQFIHDARDWLRAQNSNSATNGK